MHTTDRRRARDWIAGLLAGAAIGFVVLGIGGRAGMRIVALETGQPAAFSFEGTTTVALLGAASGAIAAAIFLLLRTALPARRRIRAVLFWAILGAIALRGLSPVTGLSASVFLPLFLVFGVLLHLFWCRVHLPRAARAAGERPVASAEVGRASASA